MKLLAHILSVMAVVFAFNSKAAADYVCSTYYDPGFLQDGSAGRVIVTTTPSAHCAGTRTSYILCSKDPVGPGMDVCAAPAYQLDETGLYQYLESLRAAAAASQPVTRVAAACAGGGSTCTAFFIFNAN